MNICFTFITPFYPYGGGIERVTHTITCELQRRGNNVFYLIQPSFLTPRLDFDYPATLDYMPSRIAESSENEEFYVDYLKSNKIDVVVNQSGNFSDSFLWVKASKLGIPVVSVLHSDPWVSYKHLWSSDVWPLRNNTFKESVKRIARVILYPRLKYLAKKRRVNHFKRLLPKTTKVCMLSPNYYSVLDEICSGYNDKYVSIPNPNSYIFNDIGVVWGGGNLDDKKKQILFVGRFGAPKREDRIIKIWQTLYNDFPDWELVMVGSGDESHENKLRTLAGRCERVIFAGSVPALEYQKTASIAVLTSNYEGFPMVLTEAMQCGCVPVSFKSFASVTDIIKDGETGLLVKPFDLGEYAEKLRLLMSDDGYRNQIAKRALEHVKLFDVSTVADEWEELFRNLIEYK